MQLIVTKESKAFYAIINNLALGTDFIAKYGKRVKFMPAEEPYLLYKLQDKDRLNDVLGFVNDILKFYHCKKQETHI